MSTAMSACAKSVQSETCREKTMLSVPCHVGDPDLWFAENPLDLERAKALCADCPIRRECLVRGAGTPGAMGRLGWRDHRARHDHRA